MRVRGDQDLSARGGGKGRWQLSLRLRPKGLALNDFYWVTITSSIPQLSLIDIVTKCFKNNIYRAGIFTF